MTQWDLIIGWTCALGVEIATQSTIVLLVATSTSLVIREPARRLTLIRCAEFALVAIVAVTTTRHVINRAPTTRLLAARPATTHVEIGEIGCENTAVSSWASPVEQSRLNMLTCPPSVPSAIEGCALQPIRSTPCGALVVRAAGPGWAAGGTVAAMLACAWLLAGWRSRRCLSARLVEAPAWVESLSDDIRHFDKRLRRVRIAVSQFQDGPCVAGVWRPLIVLPETLVATAGRERLAAIVAHECAHVARGDLFWLAIERLLMPFLIWHPLYHWLRLRARADQELIADAGAVDCLGCPVRYAEALLYCARALPNRPGVRLMPPSLAFPGKGSRVGRRIRGLLTRRQPLRTTCGAGWSILFGAIMLTLIAGSLALIRGEANISKTAHADCESCPHDAPALSVFVRATERIW